MRRTLVVTAAALAVAPASALAAKNGTYKGTLGGTDTLVQLTVKKGKVTRFDTEAPANCGTAQLITVTFVPGYQGGKGGKVKHGKFRATYSDSFYDNDKRVIKGHLSGGKVSGSIKITGQCTFKGTYTAKK